MKLISKNQLVGYGDGFAVFRNLYEKESGERVSIKTSSSFWMEDYKHLSKEDLFNKFKNDNLSE